MPSLNDASALAASPIGSALAADAHERATAIAAAPDAADLRSLAASELAGGQRLLRERRASRRRRGALPGPAAGPARSRPRRPRPVLRAVAATVGVAATRRRRDRRGFDRHHRRRLRGDRGVDLRLRRDRSRRLLGTAGARSRSRRAPDASAGRPPPAARSPSRRRATSSCTPADGREDGDACCDREHRDPLRRASTPPARVFALKGPLAVTGATLGARPTPGIVVPTRGERGHGRRAASAAAVRPPGAGARGGSAAREARALDGGGIGGRAEAC